MRLKLFERDFSQAFSTTSEKANLSHAGPTPRANDDKAAQRKYPFLYRIFKVCHTIGDVVAASIIHVNGKRL